MTHPPQLEFWFDYASTYAYLSAMRIDALGRAAGVAVVWRPFLLGPIFKDQGLSTSPFVAVPIKGQYMVRDIERIATARGLPFRMPASFPAHSVLAARVGLVAVEGGWIADYSRALFTAEFGPSHQDISDRHVIAGIVNGLGQPAGTLDQAETPTTKQALRDQTERARALGIFGSPTFLTPGGELFWGDDRLESALTWIWDEAGP